MKEQGIAEVNGARLHYELAGRGMPLVMLHAGVADRRQWANEFAHFAGTHQVLRFDMRGFGDSEPADNDYSLLGDLTALIDQLDLDEPFVLLGCSMGGGLALDYALENPGRVAALILVGSGPSGLELDMPTPAKFKEAEAAYHAEEWALLTEIETQIWFDGMGRTPDQVDPAMRQLAYEMNYTAILHEAKGLGTRRPGTEILAVDRLDQLQVPVQIIVGANDIPYILAAADYMVEHIPTARKAIIQDAGHLTNMDQPAEFQAIIAAFLASVTGP